MIGKNGLAKKIVLLSFYGLILGISGCSMFERAAHLQTNFPSTGWVQLEKDPAKPYKYEYENVAVFVRPDKDCDGFILVGPPILPILFPMIPNCGDLCIQVLIESPKDRSIFDLSNVRIELSGGESYQVNEAYLFKKAEIRSSNCYQHGYEQVRIMEKKIAISYGKTHFCLSFNIKYKAMDGFYLDLGPLTINDNNIPLPGLKFQKEWTSRYCPIEFFLHGVESPFWIRL